MPAGKRTSRQVSERELAMALVLQLAESGLRSFSLIGFYEDDDDLFDALASRLRVEKTPSLHNKITKVVRRLVNFDVLIAEMGGNQAWYRGQPSRQMEYRLRPGKATLLTQEKTDVTMGPEGEAGFLLRNAYPDPRVA